MKMKIVRILKIIKKNALRLIKLVENIDIKRKIRVNKKIWDLWKE